MSVPRRLSLALFFPTLLAAAVFGACAESDTIGATFQNLGGAGGNSTGGYSQGGDGAGGSTTTTSTTTSTTTTSTTSATTTSTTSATTSTSSGPTCVDTGAEPNDSEAAAKNLGTIDDCDGSGQSFTGVLNGPDDVDWFRYSGQDGFGCVVGPAREVMFMEPARICKYVQCEGGGDPSVTCPAGTTGDTSPGGRPGCCASDGFEMDIDCPGSDDNATTYIRIDNPNGGECISYTVSYHY